jgi:hypothetical protein
VSLAGRVGGFAVAELLQWLGASRRTGTLRAERAGFRKQVALKNGLLIACSTARAKERLGVRLLVEGRISELELREALLLQLRRRFRFGEALVELGVLTAGELREQLIRQSQDSLVDLLTWRRLSFSFDETSLPGPADRRPPRSWREIEREELARATAREERSRLHPAAETRFRVSWPEACGLTGTDALSDALLGLVAQGHSAAGICLHLHERDDRILDRLADHRSIGVVQERDRPRLPAAVAAPPEVLSRVGLALEAGQLLAPLIEAEAAADRWTDDELMGRCRRGVRRWVGSRARQRIGNLDATVVGPAMRTLAPASGLLPVERVLLGRADGRTSFRLMSRLVPFGEDLALAALAQLMDRGLIRAA